ncbi:unnamed protein product [Didymodactylos carnosus]|uniref:HAT C-terminal dimerisation domain-containing protein n=1 Tax=Didymodactylos carnosus TaxID=1234261 RepID=A0A814N708_9BILA|nr:unnamed protein product [Didymodactylos carnosus]CAF1592118.1 unnamed protein product [Didymodactylos carnosus]CAF3853709.1 unnamed protein product [Didymodactylos carnosus]CAF4396687.1 unnamed protein product [Didymodactylos carnosus]
MVPINDLDEDKLFGEYCEIKDTYKELTKTDIRLGVQIKSYISMKKPFTSTSSKHQNDADSTTDNDDQDESFLKHKNNNDAHIRPDQLEAYLLHMNQSETPNVQTLICYIFSIPCTNGYVETIFSHMKHAWSDSRNRMDNESVAAELKIRLNADFSWANFYKHLLSQPDLLKRIRTNEQNREKSVFVF